MGWGDEAEAMLRSQFGDETYEQALAQIRGEYGTFSKESPYLAGGAEFAGGAIPAAAAMIYSGGTATPAVAPRILGPLARVVGAGRTPAARTTAQNVARLATIGATEGAISGAGTATEGGRGQGAFVGGVTGGVLAPVFQGATSVAGAAFRGLRDLVVPSTERARLWALDKLKMATDDLSPGEIANRIRTDIKQGVPPSMANVTPGTVELAEAVVQRGGRGARELAEAVGEQQAGARGRVKKQVRRGLRPKDYYAEEQRMAEDLRSNANTVYESAYNVGSIDDPVINRVLQEPDFRRFFDRAKGIYEKRRLAAELDPAGDPSKFTLKQIYDPQTGQMVDTPDVRTLDYIKQGIDAEIDELFKSGKSAEAIALKELRSKFVSRLDDLVPEYKAARAEYKGDLEVLEALRMGRDEFQKLDSEQVARLVGDMSKAEREAFRTGVARNLFGMISDPSQDADFAKRIINSPEMVDSLRPVFDNPGQFNFFREALKRESEIFRAANRVLQGSATARRTATRERLEESTDSEIIKAANEAANRGMFGSLLYGAVRLFNKAVPESYWNELADMLRTGNPGEVAALVRAMEREAARRVPVGRAVSGAEAGILGGTVAAMPPAPLPEGTELPSMEPLPEGESAFPGLPTPNPLEEEEEKDEEATTSPFGR